MERFNKKNTPPAELFIANKRHGIFKYSDSGGNDGCGVVFFALFLFFDARPIRVVCPVVKGLGMGHKAENSAAGITDPGDVLYRPVGVERES